MANGRVLAVLIVYLANGRHGISQRSTQAGRNQPKQTFILNFLGRPGRKVLVNQKNGHHYLNFKLAIIVRRKERVQSGWTKKEKWAPLPDFQVSHHPEFSRPPPLKSCYQNRRRTSPTVPHPESLAPHPESLAAQAAFGALQRQRLGSVAAARVWSVTKMRPSLRNSEESVCVCVYYCST